MILQSIKIPFETYFMIQAISWWIILIIGSMFLILAGLFFRYSKNPDDETNHLEFLFTVAGIVVIISQILDIIFFFYDLYPIDSIGYFTAEMLFEIVYIIAFGVLFIIIGAKNKKENGNLLILAGVFWIISQTCYLLNVIFITLNSLMGFTYGFLLELNLLLIFLVFILVSGIIFLIHSIHVKSIYLIIAGFSIFILVFIWALFFDFIAIVFLNFY